MMGDGADDALDRIEDAWEYQDLHEPQPGDDMYDPLAGWWGDEEEDRRIPEADVMPRIEEGRSADIAWVAALDKQCFGAPNGWSQRVFREELQRRGRRLMVVRKRAFIMYRKWGRMFWVDSVAVHPRHRHKGIGRMLMEHVIGEARQHDGFRVFLEVNCANGKAIHLYEDLGFVVINYLEGYYGKNDHGFEMALIGA